MKVSHTASSAGRRFFVTLGRNAYADLGRPKAFRVSRLDDTMSLVPVPRPERGGAQPDGSYVYPVNEIINGAGYSVAFTAREPLVPHTLPLFSRVPVKARGNIAGYSFRLPKCGTQKPAQDLETIINELNRIIETHPDKPTISVVDNRLCAHIMKTIGG
jgi:hypothetical protein